jgi:hypothetical protein
MITKANADRRMWGRSRATDAAAWKKQTRAHQCKDDLGHQTPPFLMRGMRHRGGMPVGLTLSISGGAKRRPLDAVVSQFSFA